MKSEFVAVRDNSGSAERLLFSRGNNDLLSVRSNKLYCSQFVASNTLGYYSEFQPLRSSLIAFIWPNTFLSQVQYRRQPPGTDFGSSLKRTVYVIICNFAARYHRLLFCKSV